MLELDEPLIENDGVRGIAISTDVSYGDMDLATSGWGLTLVRPDGTSEGDVVETILEDTTYTHSQHLRANKNLQVFLVCSPSFVVFPFCCLLVVVHWLIMQLLLLLTYDTVFFVFSSPDTNHQPLNSVCFTDTSQSTGPLHLPD